jgi:hypothetical protein
MTPDQKKAIARIMRPFRACARKLGIAPYKKWTIPEKKAIRSCMVKSRRAAGSR